MDEENNDFTHQSPPIIDSSVLTDITMNGNGVPRKKKLTVEEKREIIKERLRNNFPIEYVFHFAIVFIEVGFVEIGLQAALIWDRAPLYFIGSGIWGGLFAILNGLLKFYLCKDFVLLRFEKYLNVFFLFKYLI